MKNSFLLILFLSIFIVGNSQNLYKATSGEISFFSETPMENIDAVNKNLKALKELAAKHKTHTKIKYTIPKIDSIRINNVFLKGNETYTRSYVLGKLKIKTNEETTYKEFTRGVNNLVATNNFDSFLYQFKPANTVCFLFLW